MKTADIQKYRGAWLGFAMLWILWCHWGVYTDFYPIAFLKKIGYGGVDICLFASGMGCFYSLCKDPSLLHFYRRRVARVFPTWLCLIPFWILWRCLTSQFPLGAILGNLLGIQHWTMLGNEFNWYISALFMLYLLAPLMKELALFLKTSRQYIGTIAALILLSVPFWTSNACIISVTRLPIFFIGMLWGKYAQTHETLCRKHLILAIGAAFFGGCLLLAANRYMENLLWSHGLFWYPFILIAPGACAVISLTLHTLRGNIFGRGLSAVLNTLGSHSFEIYLVHIFVFEVLQYMIDHKTLANRPLFWLLALPVVAVGCIALKQTTKLPAKLFSHIQKPVR